ncbi:hypothetical protein [Brasilonema sp. UFV-L1]|uniref:hypothetical protein n=1 Tax=Brasilonema sp. UFV-L1 TaxID=2234130 RepID=UPI00145CC6D4|nr:hypothetical protein [Brasilonema sp. UFV-L1]NMG11262.1 hypothetical protein [Brasilonema sp. UFV-L1]
MSRQYHLCLTKYPKKKPQRQFNSLPKTTLNPRLMNNSNTTTTTKKVEKSKAKTGSLVATALFALLGLGLVSVLPHLGQNASKQVATSSVPIISIENNGQKNDTIHVSWSHSVSQAQFWLDNSPVNTQCDQHNCTVLKGQGVSKLYFQWLNTSDNKWYYFEGNTDYRGQFKGIPL